MDDAIKILSAGLVLSALGHLVQWLAIRYRNQQIHEARSEVRRMKRELTRILEEKRVGDLSDDELEDELRDHGLLDDDSDDLEWSASRAEIANGDPD